MEDRSGRLACAEAAEGRSARGALSRRAVLGLGAAALASCATPVSLRPAASDTRLRTLKPTEPAPSTTTASPGPSVQPATGATLAQLEATYGRMEPTAWGTDVPGVVTRMVPDGTQSVALTFDACGGRGGSGYDAELIELLRRERVKATLFLNYRWIQANLAVAKDLAADPLFDLANHGTHHQPLSVRGRSAYGIPGTRSVAEVYQEVEQNAALVQSLVGHPVRLFRCGTAYYDDVAVKVVRDLGMYPVGFSVNGDGGATFTASQVRDAMRGVRPGGIVIAHMNHPERATATGMVLALDYLRRSGYQFVHLADHLG